MRRAFLFTVMVALLIILFAAAVEAEEPAPDIYPVADCGAFYVNVFELPEGSEVKVRADSTTILDTTISPYVTWAAAWPTDKRNHRLTITVRTPDGQRFREVARVRCG